MSLKQPVRYPVKYYSHLDSGAPQLTNADGIIKNILKACLVTGYGTKPGAGWTSLFEDAVRIVFRRPLGTGNPPDIKIENGVINGAASHRIVSQDNPTSINDDSRIASANLLARDAYHGSEWHLVVSDFGFILCYQMGESVSSLNGRNTILYVGSAKKIDDAKDDSFIVNVSPKIRTTGLSDNFMSSLLSNNAENYFRNLRTGVQHKSLSFLSIDVDESYYKDYIAQDIILDKELILPFKTCIAKETQDVATKVISSGNRPILRFVESHHTPNMKYPVYIPIDYWEL